MKICFVCHDISESGGTERMAINLANTLIESYNHEIFILSTYKKNKKLFFEANSKVSINNIFNSKNDGGMLKNFKKIKLIREFVKDRDIDILIDVDIFLSLFSIPALIGLKTKHIAWEQYTFNQTLGNKIRKYARILAGKFSNVIVVLTERDKQNYINNLNLKSDIVKIYNPISDIGKSVSYNESSEIILSAGHLRYYKGFDMLIEIANIVFKKYPNWTWIVLGEGEERKSLQNKIDKLGLNENVILQGNVTNINNYYENASMFVSTSRFEGFGLVLTEAKSYKIPTLSFNVEAGPAEIILDSINGYLVNPFDIDQMAEKIIFLIENPNTRREFSKKSLMDTEKFYMNNISIEWENLFKSLLQDR